MTPPSKELLGAVLGIKVNKIEYEEQQNEIVYYCNQFGRATGYINIYELMHLMKEWAWGKGFQLMSHRNYFNNKYAIQVHEKLYRHFEAESLEDTEIETVTKACEWILKEKGNE